MEDVVEQYYREGTLPEGIDHKELSEYLLSNIFPKDSVCVLDHGYVKLRSISPFPIGDYGSDYSIVESARVSYGNGITTLEKDRKLVKYLKDNRHMSPFEHITISFEVRCPLIIARHFMRYRTFSYNEVSARYTEVADLFYLPSSLRTQSKSNRQVSDETDALDHLLPIMEEQYRSAYSSYKKLIQEGVSKEQARLVLPQSMYTTFVMTGNLRNWLHFIGLRDERSAQYEIQLYAREIKRMIGKYCPISSEIYR
jgi:thymidylate synthase (FAD)